MNKKALLEAALFISEKPLSLSTLSKLLEVEISEVRNLISKLKKELESEERGIELAETAEGFEFRVKPQFREKIAFLTPLADLSNGMVRSLALLVLKPEITQAEIIKYQGNKAYGYLKKLESKGLIKCEKFGRTKKIFLTPNFEKYFGKSVEEMRKILKERIKNE